MEYKKTISPNGVVNHYPILTEEERKERHQDFLKIAHKIIKKYTEEGDKTNDKSIMQSSRKNSFKWN